MLFCITTVYESSFKNPWKEKKQVISTQYPGSALAVEMQIHGMFSTKIKPL